MQTLDTYRTNTEFNKYLDQIRAQLQQVEQAMRNELQAKQGQNKIYHAYQFYKLMDLLKQLELYELFVNLKWKYIPMLQSLGRKLSDGSDNDETENYLKTEIAFLEVVHHELLETCLQQDKIFLGAISVRDQNRCNQMMEAVKSLQKEGFYLKAIEILIKKKTLQMESFQYSSVSSALSHEA